MTPAPDRTPVRARILTTARDVLDVEPDANVGRIASRAGVSRATFYRHFRSRAELLDALEIEPNPVSRERVLAAAVELIGRDGLSGLSMDELAEVAGLSRASVYRLFPGKPALFDAVMTGYSPFGPAIEALGQAGDRPPDEVLPEVLRPMVDGVAGRMGLLRAVFFEVTAGTPDAVEGAGAAIARFLAALSGYLERQMALGRLRRMHPVLATQAVIGPLFFHLLTRPAAQRLAGLDVPLPRAVDELLGSGLAALGAAQSPGPLPPSSGAVDTPEEHR